MVAGRDFFLAFSPERVDPANPEWHTGNTPKVVGGIDRASTEAACALYGTIVSTTVPVSSTGVAEMVKLLENTFRAVNIGMANELALMCRQMGIDVWEVIDAAKTKPFGFMAFYPGPGLGGHCIPIDPFYLSWKARQSGFESRFIELAGHINGAMPRYVIERVSDALNSAGKPIKGSRVHLLGMAYKANVGDYRESPAIDIARLLEQRGARVSYSDPHVPAVDDHGFAMTETPLADGARRGHRLRGHRHQPRRLRLRRSGEPGAADRGHEERAEGRRRLAHLSPMTPSRWRLLGLVVAVTAFGLLAGDESLGRGEPNRPAGQIA